MTLNINSEAYCRKAYLNYHCYGNTMGISEEDMGKITQAWADRLSSWQATVASDENEYEFDDSEYSEYKVEGRSAAKDSTGYSGHDNFNIANASTSSMLGAGGAAWNMATGGVKAAKGLFSKNSNLFSKSTWGSPKKPEGADSVKGSAYVQAAMAIATSALYYAKKPNKDEKEACDALQAEMEGARVTLEDSQSEMEYMSGEIIDLSDEAFEFNEDANEEIEEQKTEYDTYMETFTALKEKAASGTPLTDTEKELYKSIVGYLTEIGVLIEETVEDTSEEVNDVYEDIGTFQEGYDATAETMGEVEGLTDFAEGFDKTTRAMCYVEGAGQALNAASGIAAGAKLLGLGWWNAALAAASMAAGAASGVAAAQQFTWAGEIGKEIEKREETQGTNVNTMDIYTEEIDAYDGFMQGIEDLELEVPDEIEAPEDAELPDTSAEPTGEAAVPEVLKPKKEEVPKEEA